MPHTRLLGEKFPLWGDEFEKIPIGEDEVEESEPEDEVEDSEPFEGEDRVKNDTSMKYIQYYAVKKDGSEVYAKNSMGEFPIENKGYQVYAKIKEKIGDKEYVVEKPPVANNGIVRYIHRNGIVYPMNLTTKRPIFKLNELGTEEYLTDNFFLEPHYPMDLDGKECYAKTYQEDEYPINENGRYIYAKDKDEKEIYPKDSKGNEYVIIHENAPIYAKEANKDEYYPQKSW